MSKYDLTNQLSPVQSTFVDPGLNTFKEAALTYRKTYDQNKDAYNLTKRVIAELELMPGDEKMGLKDEFGNNINQIFEDIISTGAYEDAELAVQNAVSYLTSDKTITQARKNAAEYKRDQLMIEQFGPSGVLDFNKNLGETFTTVSDDGEGNKQINRYDSKMEAKEDQIAVMTNLVSGIASDGRPWSSVIGDYLQYGNSSGVSKSKVERIVNDLYEAYIQGKAGDQDKRSLGAINGLSDEGAKADIIRRMQAIASKQVGNVTTLSGIQQSAGSKAQQNSQLYQDPFSSAMLSGDTFLNYTDFLKVSGNNEGSIPNSINVTGGSNLVLKYAKQFNEDQLASITNALVTEGLASNPGAAQELIDPLLNYKNAIESNQLSTALKIAQSLGYMENAASLNVNSDQHKALFGIGKAIEGQVGTEQLKQMGAIIKGGEADISSFVINTDNSGGKNSTAVGGNLEVDGTIYRNEEQMNNLAAQNGWDNVHTGIWDADFGNSSWTAINNMTDAAGNLLFRESTIDGVKYWSYGATYAVPYTDMNADHLASEFYGTTNVAEGVGERASTRSNTSTMIAIETEYEPIANANIQAATSIPVYKDIYKQGAQELKIAMMQMYGHNAAARYAPALKLYEDIIIRVAKTPNISPGDAKAIINKMFNDRMSAQQQQ
jgi:hypothetical protein